MDQVHVKLDALLRSGSKVDKLNPLLASLFAELERSPSQPQAWQPLSADSLDLKLPDEIASAWLFALRGGGKFPSERHPNSWQRSIALEGQAVFEVYENGAWQARPLDGASKTAGERTISIPPNMWHRIAIGPATFVSLSFHTVPAAELIEETCAGDDFSQTHRRLYQG